MSMGETGVDEAGGRARRFSWKGLNEKDLRDEQYKNRLLHFDTSEEPQAMIEVDDSDPVEKVADSEVSYD